MKHSSCDPAARPDLHSAFSIWFSIHRCTEIAAIMNTWTVLTLLALCVFTDSTNWNQLAQEEMDRALNRKSITNKARNVILFIGDGMGVSTVTAARILRGQTKGAPGEETVLEFEKFPNVGLSKTYANDRQTTGSSSTATAMMCGQKTNYLLVGLSDRARARDCSSMAGTEIPCAFQWFREDGRSVGMVTTTRITHATPACAFAKTVSRFWEMDTDMKGVAGARGCTDVAHQFIYNHSYVKVALGGGRRYFMGINHTDPEYTNLTKGAQKRRLDGADLIKVWKDKHTDDRATYVWNKAQFDAVRPSSTDYLLGLFEPNHMQYELERDKSGHGEPSLAEMTQKAIGILQKDRKGYFLMVEGGRIDHAHHDNNAKRALHEVLSLEDAVRTAVEMTDESDTLIVVSADHSHVFNIAGYPERGNDILGVVKNVGEFVAKDGLPFTTLLYANGASYDWGNRTNVSAIDTTHKDYLQVAAAPRFSETHGGEDVAIYARGPMSHIIHGVHEQHYIGHVIAYAACVGDYKQRCLELHNSAGSTISNVLLLLCLFHTSALLYFVY